MSYLRPLALLVLGAVTLTGCATYSPDVYQAGQVQQVQSVELGTVEAVRSVQIQGKSNELYTLGGTVLGGLAGSTIGRGTGSVAGAVAGAACCAMARCRCRGGAAERRRAHQRQVRP